ncbi:MAG: helix-turn-helix transcriptional regulator [Armatimonadota bacterium]|nr:helix-turn-helix domain-containing protein [Armatimonadota bacterium]MDW8156939.1 helix-turn-helix transcriptional regulator [Armatimonadota bacterium]
MGTASEPREDARAFGNYIRSLRQNFYGRGKGKSLRQVAAEAGIPPSVLSRGERGLLDLRRPGYIERLAPALGVPTTVMKRVAHLVTHEDVVYFRTLRGAGGPWARLQQAADRLRGAPSEVVEALAAYAEFLAWRWEQQRAQKRTG